MEGFILNLIATVGFSFVFLVIFFSIYYLYLKGNVEGVQEEYNVKDKSKRLEKGF
jgi:Na+-transporting methylmalonyl-CoA/oxaloacetate decarboxylase gamma subunit